MAQRLLAHEPTRIYNYRLQLDTIQELERMLLSRKKAGRAGLPGLEKGRDEIIATGTISIQTIMEAPAKQACLVSDLSLREGILRSGTPTR